MYTIDDHIIDHAILGIVLGATSASGTGTTTVYPVWSNGPAGVLADGYLANSGGYVTSTINFRVTDTTAATLRLLTNGTGSLDIATTSTGQTTYTGGGSSPKHTFNDAVIISNASTSTLSVRRSGGGGTDGLAFAVGAQGTTVTVTAGTGTQNGLVVIPSASWAGGTTFDVQSNTGVSQFKVANDTGKVTIANALAVTGVATFTAQSVHTAGAMLTNGVLNSNVTDAAAAISMLLQPSQALTSGTDRWTHVMKDSAGNVRFSIASNGQISLYSEGATNNALTSIAGAAPSTVTYGIFFTPTWGATAGASPPSTGFTSAVVGAYFGPIEASTTTATTLVGGYFVNSLTTAAKARSIVIGGQFRASVGAPANSSGAQGSWYGFIAGLGPGQTLASGKSNTWTAVYGGYISQSFTSLGSGASITDNYSLWCDETAIGTNKYGIWLAGTTAGYKAMSFGSTSCWIGPESSTTFSLNATTVIFKADADHSGKNILTDTTGTKIATATTQKLGFWNASPVAQYATTGTVTGFTANTTTPVLDGSTFTGNTGATAYTIGDVVRALKLAGFLAA